ncbi:protein cycle-like isoform X2 [Artemia franciscana]|uniref:Cycle n=2 Tax=Artemia franciscana TaxID=6661 RepID=A0AA88ILF2_ARTSF|nr:hypothetical protein QYM36_000436 [Artemia franciscana]
MEPGSQYGSSPSLLDWSNNFGELYPLICNNPSSAVQNYTFDSGGNCEAGIFHNLTATGPHSQTVSAQSEYDSKNIYLPHEQSKEHSMTGRKRTDKSSDKTPSSSYGEAGPSEKKYSRLLSASSSVASVISEDLTGFDSEDDWTLHGSESMSPTHDHERKKGNRQNHSEIEKRRRDKMNLYINELSQVVPLCVTMSHKLDKLTVLRMAVQHLKTIRGSIHSYTEGDYKPAFLSDEESKKLILQSADGFLFVVDCDRGRILYMSESVSQVLNYSQSDLLGQSWFDILHPKDVAKVKEQLSSSDLCPRERLIDAKTMLPVKTEIQQNSLHRLCPGARRSFFCRMRCKVTAQVKEEADSSTGCSGSSRHRKAYNINREKKYSVIHCTGYLKSWAPSKLGAVHNSYRDDGSDVESCNLSCLVAVGRIQPSVLSPQGLRGRIISKSGKNPEEVQLEYISRHAVDGKFTFMEQKATLIHGYLPQEILGTSVYEYLHAEDMLSLAASHKAVLQKLEEVITPVFRFRTREGTFIRLQSRLRSFRNPWTKEVESILAKNLFMVSEGLVESTDVSSETINLDLYSGARGGRQHELEPSKIGQVIADEVLESLRRSSSGGSTLGPSPSSVLSGDGSPFSANDSPGVILGDVGIQGQGDISNGQSQGSTAQQVRNNQRSSLLDLRNNRQIVHMLSEAGLQGDDEMLEVIGGLMNDTSPSGVENDSTNPNVNDSIDGNDEAAMAVVMSLLEADAGLGGPVDFSGLPWPLP